MFGALFGRRKDTVGPTGVNVPQPFVSQQKIISFRIDGDLDRRISRALAQRKETRSDLIRRAVEMLLKLEAEERLRIAHSAIRWD